MPNEHAHHAQLVLYESWNSTAQLVLSYSWTLTAWPINVSFCLEKCSGHLAAIYLYMPQMHGMGMLCAV